MKKILCIGFISLAVGCASPVKQAANEETSKKIDTTPCAYQRFLPTDFPAAGPDSRGLVALDTQTGQLCRTADYSFEKPIAGLNKIPTCLSLTQIKQEHPSNSPTLSFKDWEKTQTKPK